MAESPKIDRKIPIFNAQTGTIEEVGKIIKSEEEWRTILTPEQFKIMRLKGTERPFSAQCPLPPKGARGIYQCAGCSTDLFVYDTKFDSKTGWPSFWQPVSELNVKLEDDNGMGIERTEALCARCGAHLGHVFNDGPPPTGLRYCINAAALKLAINSDDKIAEKETPRLLKASFAAGCFWGIEDSFRQIKGVVSVRSGYAGGRTKNPSYEQVCSGKTGHAEAVELEYNPSLVSYDDLLDTFWKIHDPTTLNKQGPDTGEQYRSAIFYYTPEQKTAALNSKRKKTDSKTFKEPIVTEITAAAGFFPAEEYHQRYYEKHGIKGCGIKINK